MRDHVDLLFLDVDHHIDPRLIIVFIHHSQETTTFDILGLVSRSYSRGKTGQTYSDPPASCSGFQSHQDHTERRSHCSARTPSPHSLDAPGQDPRQCLGVLSVKDRLRLSCCRHCRQDSRGWDFGIGLLPEVCKEQMGSRRPVMRVRRLDHVMASVLRTYLLGFGVLSLEDLEGLKYAKASDNSVSCRNGRDDISCHLLDIESRFSVNAENRGPNVCACCHKVECVFIIFIKRDDWIRR